MATPAGLETRALVGKVADILFDTAWRGRYRVTSNQPAVAIMVPIRPRVRAGFIAEKG